MYIHFIHGYGGDGMFTHTALYSAPPLNTRITYDTVWFSFEGGKDTEVRKGKLAFHRFYFRPHLPIIEIREFDFNIY